jgi:hypothetical protein
MSDCVEQGNGLEVLEWRMGDPTWDIWRGWRICLVAVRGLKTHAYQVLHKKSVSSTYRMRTMTTYRNYTTILCFIHPIHRSRCNAN